MLEKLLLLRPILKAISDGKIFTILFSWFLKILSGIIALASLYGSWLLWSNLSKITGGMGGESSFKFFLGAAFAEVLILALVFIVINILLIRLMLGDRICCGRLYRCFIKWFAVPVRSQY